MAPRGKAAVKAAARAAAKAAAKDSQLAIKDKEEEESRKRKFDEEALAATKAHRAANSGMLGFLKWNANPLGKNPEMAAKCSATLEALGSVA